MTTTIAEYSKTEAALAELRTKYAREYDVTTPSGLDEARTARAEIRRYRIDLEKMRVEIKEPALKRCKLIDSEARRITEQLEALETPIDEKIKSEERKKDEEKARIERAKQERLEASQRHCNLLRVHVVEAVNRDAAAIQQQIAAVRLSAIVADEHRQDVEAVRDQVLGQLKNMLEKAIAAEQEAKKIAAERAELDRLRAEAMKRETAEREKIEAERRKSEAERQAADAKAKAEREAADAAAAKMRAAEEAKLRAERAKLDAERDAAEALARRQRDENDRKLAAERVALEEKTRAERQAADERARKEALERQRKMDGRQLLQTFCATYGDDPEFAEVAGSITAWLLQASKPAKKASAR